MTLFSMAFSLFLLMDSIGNVPIFIAILKEISPKRQRKIIFRELILALIAVIIFYFIGDPLLTFMHISQQSVLISGGIILFIIALKLIFPPANRNGWQNGQKEPFLVPLAIPLVAGPAVLATVMLYSRQEIGHFMALSAIFIAWVASTIVLLSASYLRRVLGEKGLSVCEKLMGLILVMLAVQMFLDGIAPVFHAKP